MDELIRYCDQYAQGFSRKLVGANEHDIARVEEKVGRPLAPEHRAFLSRMGRTPTDNLGEFLKSVEFGVEAIVRFYSEPPVPVPPDATYVWTLDFDNEMFLRLQEEAGAHPLIAYSWSVDSETGRFTNDARQEHMIARSLFQYLYREAVLRIRVATMGHHAEFRARSPGEGLGEGDAARNARRSRFRTVSGNLGCHPVPYVEGKQVFFERPGAVLMLFTEEVASDSIHVHADDSREFARLCAIVDDHLDVERWS
ncbi:hypothetical protein [Myxococcus eversor]|uniref:hypothetical protein n=1 Tax=Myxococcus eversor TaxID=2709661 RepID=UPI0013D20721|nr:hypothetical protein [Myxococcus eversor]